ncbi:MAG: hypothetical protein KJI71_01625 [Patescibacteria group bacterium]|nr:hypothetical protein [Patescibacteria group bacterium]
MSNKETIDLRLPFKIDDPIYKAFLKIKKATGIKNNSEVLRLILKVASNMKLSDFLGMLSVNYDSDKNPENQNPIETITEESS